MAYSQYGLSTFPENVDVFSKKQDPTAAMLAVIKQYQGYLASGNLSDANALKVQYPALADMNIIADDFNHLTDAVGALEQFFMDEVEGMIHDTAQKAAGINDNPNTAQETLVTFSAKKINDLIAALNTLITSNTASLSRDITGLTNRIASVNTVTLSANGWSSTSPATQTVSLTGILGSHSPCIAVNQDLPKAERKAQEKQFYKHIDRCKTDNGSLIFECDNSKPMIDLSLMVKGI